LQQRPKKNSLKQFLQLFSEQRCSREKCAFVNSRKNSGERTNKKKFLTSCCRVQKTLDKTEEAAQGGRGPKHSKQATIRASKQSVLLFVCYLKEMLSSKISREEDKPAQYATKTETKLAGKIHIPEMLV
jgi:hypothetical protein